MLICLVRDSLSQCFFNTCYSISPGLGCSRQGRYKVDNKNKPRCKQPTKHGLFATEIRAEEQKAGGQSYEVILADACGKSPVPPVVHRQISKEDIDQKLAAAEERRKSFEMQRKDTFAERLKRMSEAADKRAEIEEKFIKETSQAMEEKHQEKQQKREQYLNDLKNKVKEHIEQVESVRSKLEDNAEKLLKNIQEKLESAESLRNENLQNLVKKCKEHEEKVLTVKEDQLNKLKKLDSQIQTKLQTAQKKREEEMEKKMEQLREHSTKLENIKIAQEEKEKQEQEKLKEHQESLEKKLEKGEKNRQAQKENKLDNLHKHNVEHVKNVNVAKENVIKKTIEKTGEDIKSKFDRADINRNSLKQILKERLENMEQHAEKVRQNKAALKSSGEENIDVEF